MSRVATSSKTNTISSSARQAKSRQNGKPVPPPMFQKPVSQPKPLPAKPQPVPKATQLAVPTNQEIDYAELKTVAEGLVSVKEQLDTKYAEITRLKETERGLIARLASITTSGKVQPETCGLCGLPHTGTDC